MKSYLKKVKNRELTEKEKCISLFIGIFVNSPDLLRLFNHGAASSSVLLKLFFTFTGIYLVFYINERSGEGNFIERFVLLSVPAGLIFFLLKFLATAAEQFFYENTLFLFLSELGGNFQTAFYYIIMGIFFRYINKEHFRKEV